jgi:hypothetical protein
MLVRIMFPLLPLLLFLTGAATGAPAGEPAVSAKQWPPGYFFRYDKLSVKEKERMLENLAAALAKLNQEGYGLIAKGAIIGGVRLDLKTYERLSILDDSGLVIIARRVPNLYFRYRGPQPPNPNTYLVLKNLRVNEEESGRRYGLVVEGDFVAYAAKFVTAIMEGWERAADRESGFQEALPRGQEK